MVGICVLDDVAVEDVVHAEGLLGGMRPGTFPGDPQHHRADYVRRIGEAAAERSVHVQDAPVSGGRNGALKRSLSIMVVGEVDVLERVRPVLETYGNPIGHVEIAGAASPPNTVVDLAACAIERLV